MNDVDAKNFIEELVKTSKFTGGQNQNLYEEGYAHTLCLLV
jgi:hypothetical protein